MSTIPALAVTQEGLERMLVEHLAQCVPAARAEELFAKALAARLSLLPLKLLPARIGKQSVVAARSFLRALGVPVIRVNHKEQFVDLNVLETAIRQRDVAVPAARGPVLRREGGAGN